MNFLFLFIDNPTCFSGMLLFSRAHNNHPLRTAREKVGKESFKWAERLTELVAQFGAIELCEHDKAN
jgi:hypothetical protein